MRKLKMNAAFNLSNIIVLAVFTIFPAFAPMFSSFAEAGINEIRNSIETGVTASTEGSQKAASSSSAAKVQAESYELAIINDLHINKKEYEDKERVLKTLNGWNDIDAVAVLGDLSHKNASPAEFALSKKFLDGLRHKKYVINGNHDYRYSDQLKSNGGIKRGKVSLQKEKLERFIKAYGLKSPHYAVKAAGYLLVFLCDDEINGKYLVTLSNSTLKWLDKTLDENKKMPTLIFCHAPLEGSLKKIGSLGPSSFAQPADRIEKILKAHKQVIVWTAGHTHMSPSNENFNSSRTFWRKQVHVVINPNLGKGTLATKMILKPDCVIVKIYDCGNKKWLKKYEKKFEHNFLVQINNEKKEDDSNKTTAKDDKDADENTAADKNDASDNENNALAEDAPDPHDGDAAIAGLADDENASSNNSASTASASGNDAYAAANEAHEKYVKAYEAYVDFLDADKSSEDPEVQKALTEYRNSFDEYQRLVVAASNSD